MDPLTLEWDCSTCNLVSGMEWNLHGDNFFVSYRKWRLWNASSATAWNGSGI